MTTKTTTTKATYENKHQLASVTQHARRKRHQGRGFLTAHAATSMSSTSAACLSVSAESISFAASSTISFHLLGEYEDGSLATLLRSTAYRNAAEHSASQRWDYTNGAVPDARASRARGARTSGDCVCVRGSQSGAETAAWRDLRAHVAVRCAARSTDGFERNRVSSAVPRSIQSSNGHRWPRHRRRLISIRRTTYQSSVCGRCYAHRLHRDGSRVPA
jgi:hypothetical protein